MPTRPWPWTPWADKITRTEPSPESAAERERLRDAVIDAMRSVPAGRVATYGDIAEAAGIGPRRAGRLVAEESDSGPWWRILYADGTTAHCHDGTAPELLASEGVGFRGPRVDMKRFRIGSTWLTSLASIRTSTSVAVNDSFASDDTPDTPTAKTMVTREPRS